MYMYIYIYRSVLRERAAPISQKGPAGDARPGGRVESEALRAVGRGRILEPRRMVDSEDGIRRVDSDRCAALGAPPRPRHQV